MKKMKWLLPAVAALALLAGCQRELKTETVSLEDSVEAEGMDAACNVTCEFEYVVGGVSQEVMDAINGSIIANHILFDEAEGATDVAEAAKIWVDQQLESYRMDVDKMSGDYDDDSAWMFNFEFGRSGQFGEACKSRHLQTYNASYNEYTGGAHGMYGFGYDVYDMKTGQIITESDLFAEGYEEGVSELLAIALDDYLTEIEESDDMIFSLPEPNGNFGVSEEGVTWTYNPYEIAPYAMGVIDLTVSWADLKPYLK